MISYMTLFQVSMFAVFEILQQQRQQMEQTEDAQVPRVIPRDRMNPFIYLTEEEFIRRYRLPKHVTRNLVEDIKPRAPAVHNNRGMMAPKKQVSLILDVPAYAIEFIS